MARSNLRRAGALGLGVALLAMTGSCIGPHVATADAGPQGWNSIQQSDWYGGKQGSRLMPYAWFKALEQADNSARFADPANLARFRFLARPDQPLPIGFAVDDNDDTDMTFSKLRWFDRQGSREHWVGLNCAACHTGEIAFGDKPPLRIDGGPSLVDFQSFTAAVDRALIATRDDPAKWERFASIVLKGRDTPANRTQLKAAYGQFLAWQAQVATLDATESRYGYGRLDAVGRIFNKVALFAHPTAPVVNPPDAPVSYPFLWDIWRQDRLQWNGIAQTMRLKLGDRFLDYGAMGRNTGEVIGVFGDVDTTPRGVIAGFHSSVWADNLDRIEVQLRSLRSPRWPTALFGEPSADQIQQRERGKALFAQSCAACHASHGPEEDHYAVFMAPLRARDGTPVSPWTADPNRTDPWMACNAYTYNARSGNLTGVKDGFFQGPPLGAVAPTGTLLATTVKGTLIGKKGQLIRTAANTFFSVDRPPIAVPQDFPDTPEGRRAARLQRCLTDDNKLLAYKARPLDGIWATAPYLHNGSVPTLYDLLLPADRRPKTFRVGTRQYDPVKAGYRTDGAPGNDFLFDTSLQGNANAGHDYGTSRLSDADRGALLEYLKSL